MTSLDSGGNNSQAGPSRPQRRPVILFKSPSPRSPFEDDPYHSLLLSEGYDPTFLPVVTEVYHTAELKTALKKGGDGWEAVIVMSRRGGEAWVRAGREMVAEGIRPQSGWEDVQLFCVGRAAMDELDRDTALPRGFKPDTSAIPRAGKTALELAEAILYQPSRADLLRVKSRSQNGSTCKDYRPYLVLQGDKSLGQLPAALLEAGRQVDTLEVYETIERPDFAAHLYRTLGDLDTSPPSAREGGEGEEIWLAFFAPSSAGMALAHLRNIESVAGSPVVRLDRADCAALYDPEVDGGKGRGRIRVFAIGETTEAFLRGEGVRVDAVAETPSAEGMLAALRKATMG